MHDSMLYGPIQGQGHVALKVKFLNFQNLSPLPFSVGLASDC